MGLTMIRTRERIAHYDYHLSWRYRGDDPAYVGCGVWTPCDEEGNVTEADLNPAALASYRDANERGISRYANGDVIPLEFEGILSVSSPITIPALGRCECGREVELYDYWANACECGREYNISGQLLAPREDWGEETGERFV